MIFKLQGELIIDESKPVIAFYDKGDLSSYTYIYGAARVIREKLKDHYNIIDIGSGLKKTDNYYQIDRHMTDTLMRKIDSPDDYIEKNSKIIDGWLKESFKDLPVLDYIIMGTDDYFRLPLTGYVSKKDSEYLSEMMNEFFDYTGTDEKIINDIDKANKDVVKNWDKRVSPLAFSTRDYSLFMRSIKYIHSENKLKNNVIGFSIDPAIYTPYFDVQGIPAKFYYFAEDKRGTRNFEQLDISQLQHIIYDSKFDTLDDWDIPSTPTKTHNMFFAGTIFQEKGTRAKIWSEFLVDVSSDKCSYYIPLRKNGIIKKADGPNDRQISILEERFPDLYNDVKNHKHFKGGLTPTELHDRQTRYKYGMVFRCVSINDSLNFRPVFYTYKDILPFFDYMYDPEFLQVPERIQKKLTVRNAADIDNLIEYYNNNDNERKEILNELKELFRINEYINNADKMINDQIRKIIPEYKG